MNGRVRRAESRQLSPRARNGPRPGPPSAPSEVGSDAALQEIERAVAANYDRLSPAQRLVIDRLLADVRYAAVISAPELAQAVGVSESTVTRAAQTLGFAGYPDLQVRLRVRFISAMPDRLSASLEEFHAAPEEAGIRVILEDAESVRATAEHLSPTRLREAVDMLVAARRVYIVGARGSRGLAHILGLGLRLLLPDVRVLSLGGDDLPDQLLSMCADDTLVTISLRRVDRMTTESIQLAREVHARTLAITDDLSSRLARLADLVLLIHPAPVRLLPSYAAAASVVNALTTVVSLRTRDTADSSLKEAERLWQRFQVHADD